MLKNAFRTLAKDLFFKKPVIKSGVFNLTQLFESSKFVISNTKFSFFLFLTNILGSHSLA